MKSNYRQIVAASLVAVVVIASVVARNGAALPNLTKMVQPKAAPSTLPETLDELFVGYVQAAIQKNAQAQTLDEWVSSGSTPSDIFANAEARRTDKKRAYAALCKALSGVSDTQLALFQGLLTDTKARKQLRCAPLLSARLNSFWEARTAALKGEVQARLPGAASRGTGNATVREIFLDPSKGERITGSLAEGYLREYEFVVSIGDGPSPIYTRSLLDTLKARGMRANFFNGDSLARQWPALVKAEQSEGHIVGSHSLTQTAKTDMRSAENEIKRSRRVVANAAGSPTPFFRFPVGSPVAALGDFLKQQGITAFHSNIDSQDWKRTDPADLFRYQIAELERARSGIILINDSRKQTEIVLPYLLDELQHRGWKAALFVPK